MDTAGIPLRNKGEAFAHPDPSGRIGAGFIGINLNAEIDTASPLTIYGAGIDAAIRYVEAGIPIMPCNGITMGSEGPATTAGTIVQQNATLLAFVVLAQLVKEGAPLVLEHGVKPMDMQQGTPWYGTVSHSLASAMTNQIFRKYEIPSCTSAGFTSSSKTIDL